MSTERFAQYWPRHVTCREFQRHEFRTAIVAAGGTVESLDQIAPNYWQFTVKWPRHMRDALQMQTPRALAG